MEAAKEKISVAVQEYKRLFPVEYQQFLKSHQITIGKQKDQWGSTGKESHALERHLYDLPEKLHHSIIRMLSDEEHDWWAARGNYIKNFAAAQWFIKKHPEFKVTKQF